MRIIRPQSRAEWFISGIGLIRKNIYGWDDDKPLPGFKVCLYGYYNRKYDSIAEIAEANWQAYCERHKYALRMFPGAYEDSGTDIVDGDREKFKLYYDIRGLFDVVMYLDVDSIIMNTDVRIESVLSNKESPYVGDLSSFLWTYDENGPNSSLLIARTDDTTERHLRFAYERAKTENNVRHGKIELGGISDQDSMRDLMGIPPFSATFGNCFEAESVGICYKWQDYKPSDWIVTFPGMSFEEKLAKMREFSARALAKA